MVRTDHANRDHSCGSSTCDRWMLMRLSTVADAVAVIEGDYGLSAAQIWELTGLQHDVVSGPLTTRNGTIYGL